MKVFPACGQSSYNKEVPQENVWNSDHSALDCKGLPAYVTQVLILTFYIYVDAIERLSR